LTEAAAEVSVAACLAEPAPATVESALTQLIRSGSHGSSRVPAFFAEQELGCLQAYEVAASSTGGWGCVGVAKPVAPYK
jgi:hypothetical protein